MATPAAKKLITLDEYHQMGEDGVFLENNRVELIEGEILEMAPIGGEHVWIVANLHNYLAREYADKLFVFSQSPIELSNFTEPLPDLVATQLPSSPRRERPITLTNTLFVVEVSVTTLRHDRDRKLPLYAQAGIPEVWIVDVNNETVTVYSRPEGNLYKQTDTYKRGEAVRSTTVPGLTVPMNVILG